MSLEQFRLLDHEHINRWIPASAGSEEEHVTATGARVQLVWNPAERKLAWMNLETMQPMTEAEEDEAQVELVG